MIKKLNALGDRVLGVMLPKTTASAEGYCISAYEQFTAGSCTHYCYRWSGGARSAEYVKCPPGPCWLKCYDCC